LSDLDIKTKTVVPRIERLRRRNHPECILCDGNNGLGLDVGFTVTDDGAVTALVTCGASHQGYTGILHGGIMALLLDGAMTNCLFARGVTAMTAEMNIRYLRAAKVDKPMRLTARIVHTRLPLYILQAEVFQEGEPVARASGKFMIK